MQGRTCCTATALWMYCYHIQCLPFFRGMKPVFASATVSSTLTGGCGASLHFFFSLGMYLYELVACEVYGSICMALPSRVKSCSATYMGLPPLENLSWCDHGSLIMQLLLWSALAHRSSCRDVSETFLDEWNFTWSVPYLVQATGS